MQFLADLRSKAAGSLTFVQTRLDEAKVQVTEFVMLAAAGVKQAAEKVSAPITSRIAGVLLTVKSARSAVLERAYQARAAVLDLATSTKARVVGLQADVQAKGIRACVQDRATSAQLLARESTASAKERAGELYTVTGELVSQKSFPTTAASATAGAVTLGAGGAATGAMTGGLAGAVAGLPLALFTFGLSIPAGAVVGGGAGLVLGTVAGATTGFLGGGVAGYGVYQKKDDIRGAVSSAYTKASGGAELVKGRAVKSVEYAKDAVVAAKARLARAGTGEAGEHMD
mmetsp:Transcript_84079/g.271782  ORF Transcript_84079/g.271782 Transcript_84079/m.271782 type:complete len:286 (-) Transcript_84079:278-1135(-)